MEEWDPRKMLDLYIYDYLVRKNLKSVAEIFVREADITLKPVAINSPEGFLSEWWSLFWDLFSAKLAKRAQVTEGCSTSQICRATENAQNVHSASPLPDINYMLQNICPAHNLLQTVSPTIMPRPDMGNLIQNAPLTTTLRLEFDPNSFGLTPISDINMEEGQTVTNLMAVRMHELECVRLPASGLNSNTQLNVDQLACTLPSSSSFSSHQKNLNNKQPFYATMDDNVGNDVRGSVTGRNRVCNQIPTAGQSSTKNFLACSAHFQQDSMLDLAAKSLGKQLISGSESSAKIGSTWVCNSSKKKDLHVGKNAEMEKPLDEDIEAYLSNDEAPDDTFLSFWSTSPQSSSATKSTEQQELGPQTDSNWQLP